MQFLAHTIRENLITRELEGRLFSYFATLSESLKTKLIAVNGTENHIHLLVSLPSTTSVANLMHRLKGSSSHWISKTFPELKNFKWQDGYGAFSIGGAQIESTIAYIQKQKEHHSNQSLKDELNYILNINTSKFQ